MVLRRLIGRYEISQQSGRKSLPLLLPGICTTLELSNIYVRGMGLAVLSMQEGQTMKKSLVIASVNLLTASVMLSSWLGNASAHPPGNHRLRDELRQDTRELQELRRQRNRELREGDWREARQYNEKIREQEREVRQDWWDLHRADRDRWHWDWRDRRWERWDYD